MSYLIEVKFSNGYRCGCCSRTWEKEWTEETLEEALKNVPTTLEDGEPHQFNGDIEIKSVQVTENGELVAYAMAHWAYGGGRGTPYQYTNWAGCRPDSGAFDVVYSGREKIIDRPWADLMKEIAEARRVEEVAKAERQLAEAQQRLGALRGS